MFNVQSQFSLLPARILGQSLCQAINLIVGGPRLLLETLVLVHDHRKLLHLRNQVVILALKLLPFDVRFLEIFNFGFQ